MGIPEISLQDTFPIDVVLLETSMLRQFRICVEQAHAKLLSSIMNDVEIVDIPEQINAIMEWAYREEKVRETAISDYNHGINPKWPPEIVPLAQLRRKNG